MRVRVQPCDDGGCGFYRTIWPSLALQAMGMDVDLRSHRGDWPAAHWRTQAGHPDRIVAVEPIAADVLVIQRPMHSDWLTSIPMYQAQGVAVVVELDDDFTQLPKGHPSRAGSAGRTSPKVNRRNLRRACELADLVTCTTPAIADRYAPGRSVVIPNCVPASYLTYERPERDDGVRVGWTGSTVTHVDDLRAAGDGIAAALAGRPFHVVGTGHGVTDQLGLAPDQVVPTGWVEIGDYPTAYAGLDVAVVPLADNEFNRAKSWLKGIEAAALGVPFVASATEPYAELASLGAGMLARTADEWRIAVRLLTDNHGARQENAGNGRQVASQWTVEGNAWRWAEAWEQALLNRRQKAAA
jgi:glycosyltransferase involved in cell wall biosynthesis